MTLIKDLGYLAAIVGLSAILMRAVPTEPSNNYKEGSKNRPAATVKQETPSFIGLFPDSYEANIGDKVMTAKTYNESDFRDPSIISSNVLGVATVSDKDEKRHNISKYTIFFDEGANGSLEAVKKSGKRVDRTPSELDKQIFKNLLNEMKKYPSERFLAYPVVDAIRDGDACEYFTGKF